MSLITLAVNAANPGEYLAVCGVIELVSRFDKTVTSTWIRQPGMATAVPGALSDVCEIQTFLEEPELAQELAKALGSRDAWIAVTDVGRASLTEAVGKWVAGVEFGLPGCHEAVVIDYWYEWAFLKGGHVVQKLDSKHDGKSSWKFWAGRHDSKGIAGLLLDLVDGASGMTEVKQMQDVFTFVSRGRSPLKFDAWAARSAIDRGISANESDAEGVSARRPGLELLAAMGVSCFFPPRRYGDAAPEGTVGVQRRLFRYCTWNPQVPISVARLCARGTPVPGFDLSPREAPIGMMGQYKHLRFARPAGVTSPIIAGNAASVYEEEIMDEDKE